ncbi:interleukin-31 receptor subunit alpha-like [Hoplias malabaricus]|uniref:interleukin-31 receptor subunit alpha-like n=1 Tax=Hoplias malabaricus TaxID=27720 RepID=UPI0034623027
MGEKSWNLKGFVFWIWSTYMILGSASSTAPSVTHCELLHHANITCYWTAVSSEITNYTLAVNITDCETYANYKPLGFCSTTHRQCAVNIGSVFHCFCVDVLASSPAGTLRSARHCFLGSNEVKMYPPNIKNLIPVPRNPHCLRLEWTEDLSIYPHSEKDKVVLQIEYRTHQVQPWTVRTAHHSLQIELCGLSPGTKYYVRIRAQDTRAQRHWSSWSVIREVTTAEAAPSAAPEVWRHIQPEKGGQKLITLLWKPPQWPDCNGVILHYAASCWSDADRSHWECGYLDSSSTSCSLPISAHTWTCNLTTSNSAGTSPAAYIHIAEDGNTVLGTPIDVRVTPLDDLQLRVEWTATVDQSEASFVVEWFPIPNNTANALYWKILNGSAKSFNITDGVFPEVPYNVSVQVLYKTVVGAAGFDIAFSRQGAPSVGPVLEVLQTASDHVILKWEAVPLEKLHGFVQNYTILYKTNGKERSRMLGGNVQQFSLSGLSAGEYSICVKVHTAVGGAEGPWVTVAVDNHYIKLMAIVLCTAGILLIFIILLSQIERIHQLLCPSIPDPAKSSLSNWSPVSESQHKSTILDVRPPSSLFELIYVGGKTGLGDHHRRRQDHSQIWGFSYQSVPTQSINHEIKSHANFQRSVLAKTDKGEVGQYVNAVNAEEYVQDLNTDLCCKAKMVMKQSDLQTQVFSSYQSVSEPCLGMDVVDPPFSRKCVSKLELGSQIQGSSESPSVAKSSLGVEEAELVYTNVSTDVHVPDCYSSLRTKAKDSSNPHHKNGFIYVLDSCFYTQLTSTYVQVPEATLAYADLLLETVDSTEDHHQGQLISDMEYCCYSHVPSNYVDVPVSLSEDGESTSSQSHMCTDLQMIETYRPLGPEEYPRLLRMSLPKTSTEDSTDVVES